MPGSRGRFVAFFLISLALVPDADGSAPADADLHLSDFYRDPVPAGPYVSPRRGDPIAKVFEALLGDRVLPVPCASSLLLDLRRHRESLTYAERDALRLLTTRPVLPRDEARQTRDGRYTIHYTLDPSSPDAIEGIDFDFNGVPDRVDRVEEALDRAERVLHARLTWPLPAAGPRSDRYDVFLARLGRGGHGFAVPDREIPSTPQEDASSYIVLDSGLEGSRLSAGVIHQFAHASLLGLNSRAPAWWNEATAAWLEVQATGDPTPHQSALSRRLERLDLSLAGDSLTLSMGNYLWASFLADWRDGDAERVRQVWLQQSTRAAESPLAIQDEILRRVDDGTLEEAFREFTWWTLFTGPRDDGEHFRLGGLLPELTPRAVHGVFPIESAGLELVEPLGAAVYRLAGDGSRGSLKVRFEAAARGPLQVDLVITPSGEGRRPYLVELTPDADGQAEVGLPWRTVSEAMMIVRNPARDGKPAGFRYSARMDPLFPFELSSFTALSSPGGITLQWSTAREEDLLGWNVYRSADPNGPFLRLNPVALPSGGDSQEDTEYIYQDTAAGEGRRYFYLVEGITLQGLPDRSFPISARAGEAEPGP